MTFGDGSSERTLLEPLLSEEVGSSPRRGARKRTGLPGGA